MARGDHIFVKRFEYFHHEIDLGNGEVIHYTGEPGRKSDASIKKTPMKEFACNGFVEILEYSKCLPIYKRSRLLKKGLAKIPTIWFLTIASILSAIARPKNTKVSRLGIPFQVVGQRSDQGSLFQVQ